MEHDPATTPPHRVAVLAAMRDELKPFVRRLSLRRSLLGDDVVYRGTMGGTEVVATILGVGTRAAAEVTERLLDAVPVDRVLVIGISGGVDRGVPIGTLVVPEVVVDEETGDEFQPAPVHGITPRGRLWTTNNLHLDEPTMARLRGQGVVALDMETAGVASVCQRRGCPWSVFRAISDRATEGLVDEGVFRLLRPDGTPDLPAVARLLLARPWKLPHLIRLGRDMRTAVGVITTAAVQELAVSPDGRR
jgi:nucleoside phosphorylase